MLLRSMQNTKELADGKAENDALRDDVAAGHRQFYIKAVCQSVREATTACSGVDNAASPTGRHRWTGLFHLRERLILCKNNWKEPEVYYWAVQIGYPIDGQLMQLLWAIHTRFSGV